MVERPAKSKADLETIIDRHLQANVTNAPLYLEALRERATLGTKDLKLERTVACIRAAAREREFVTYGDLAVASEAIFVRVRHQMTEHLEDVVFWGLARSLDFALTAIVVTEDHRKTGKMEEPTLNGFFSAARRCRLVGEGVVDRAVYLKDQQTRVFDWGKQGAPL